MANHTSLNAATGTSPGPVLYMGAAGASSFGLQVVSTGSPAVVIVTLEGSLNGSNFFVLSTWTSVTMVSGDIDLITDKVSNYVRANLTTLTGGSSPTVTATISEI